MVSNKITFTTTMLNGKSTKSRLQQNCRMVSNKITFTTKMLNGKSTKSLLQKNCRMVSLPTHAYNKTVEW